MKMKLKYGENAWQEAMGVFSDNCNDPLALHKFVQVSGGKLSYNNVRDMDRLLQTITHIAAVFDFNRGEVPYIAVGCKHGNSCGAATGNDKLDTLRKMISGDPLAIFGGLVMINFPFGDYGEDIVFNYLMPANKRRFLSSIISPHFKSSVIDSVGNSCVLLKNTNLNILDCNSLDRMPLKQSVRGGYLQQQNYTYVLDLNDPDLQKYGKATKEQEDDMLLAWAIGSTSNSNTVTIVKDGFLFGNGVGQQARVHGCNLAINRSLVSGHSIKGAVVYSDSFFPFNDGPKTLVSKGIKAILSTSGSKNDDNVIKFCQEKNIVLYLIPDKKGRGFFGH